MKRRRIPIAQGILSLCALIIVGLALLWFAHLQTGIDSYLLQLILLLTSMILLFFSMHPLAHYVAARLLGAHILYFYLAHSDFGKIKLPGASRAASMIPTIGTKLENSGFRRLSATKREIIMGAGVVVSSICMLVPLLFAFYFQFSFISLVVGGLLVLGNAIFELAFSTKVGDLHKVRLEKSRG